MSAVDIAVTPTANATFFPSARIHCHVITQECHQESVEADRAGGGREGRKDNCILQQVRKTPCARMCK